MSTAHLKLIALCILCVAAVLGCKKQTPVRGDFRAADTAGKVPAIVDASRASDRQSLAELVYALNDSDAAVRLFAIQSLKDRTGQDLGYRYYAAPEQRDAATRRWRAWLAENNAAAPTPAE